MVAPWVAGIDIGTSAVKAVGYGLAGTRIARTASSYPMRREPGGIAEQAPDDWWTAVSAAVAELVAIAGSSPMAVGMSGQVGTQTLLNEAGVPLLPALAWQDARSQECVPEALELMGADSSDYGDHYLPMGAAWLVPRYLYLQRHHAEAVDWAAWICQPKDYVGLKLTGTLASDISSLRGAVSQLTGEPLEVPRRLGLELLLPPALGPMSLLGRVRPVVAEATGLAAGTPVFVGLSDFAAALLGAGVTHRDQGFDVSGTSEHVGVVTETMTRRPGIASWPVPLPGADRGFVSYGVSSNGGSLLD